MKKIILLALSLFMLTGSMFASTDPVKEKVVIVKKFVYEAPITNVTITEEDMTGSYAHVDVTQLAQGYYQITVDAYYITPTGTIFKHRINGWSFNAGFELHESFFTQSKYYSHFYYIDVISYSVIIN